MFQGKSVKMQSARLGKGGPFVSRIGLGSWITLGQTVIGSAGKRCVDAALDLGINFFDTADAYGEGAAEKFLGECLQERARDRIILGTKCFFPVGEGRKGLSRKHIFYSVENSLKHLKTDYIDLMQCHRFDPETPLAETVGAMEDLVAQGKIRYWGVSRWTAAQVDDACALMRAGQGPVSNQWPYNIFNNGIEFELMESTLRSGCAIVAYSPLAQGVLSGKYGTLNAVVGEGRAADPALRPSMWDFTPEKLAKVQSLAPIARDLGATLSQLALAWCLRKPAVASVLIGASRPEQVAENIAALEFIPRLNDEILAQIESIMERKQQ